jgi:hypothetical protein
MKRALATGAMISTALLPLAVALPAATAVPSAACTLQFQYVPSNPANTATNFVMVYPTSTSMVGTGRAYKPNEAFMVDVPLQVMNKRVRTKDGWVNIGPWLKKVGQTGQCPMPGQMPEPMQGQTQQRMPGQPMPAQPMPAQPMPAQPMPAQPMQGQTQQRMPAQPMPAQPMPGTVTDPMTGRQVNPQSERT